MASDSIESAGPAGIGALLHNMAANVRESVHDFHAVILRNLDGSIAYWNVTSERNYGFTRNEAVGSVSHHLLETIFPRPLSEINECLQTAGVWEGELIHTLSDGSRVKVRSRWQLVPTEADSSLVLEVNEPLSRVEPNTAFLEESSGAGARSGLLRRLLASPVFWLVLPVVLLSVGFAALMLLTESHHVLPVDSPVVLPHPE